MIPAQFIRKKRDRGILSPEEIEEFFSGVTSGAVADYQASAMLMAIWLNGMDIRETAALTKVMRDSGKKLDWKDVGIPVVDKHSTGGVGDKTSLVLLPLCALHDVVVPMISGRGLGHTGGTLDKLESIPGMDVFLTADVTKKLAKANGGVFIGQTGELAPLDKKLYALRDVTATVESVPLITASILSKKLAGGLDCLTMDVKYGSGAFMRELPDAVALAKSILAVGQECGLRMSCLVTHMGTPLGRTAGNSLEVIECIEIMKGGGPSDTTNLSLDLACDMLRLAYPKLKQEDIRKNLVDDLASGRCFERFCKIVKDQGGDISYLEKPSRFRKAPIVRDVFAPREGYVCAVDVRALGLAVVSLGGGRKQVSDKINFAVGLDNMRGYGEKTDKQTPLVTIHAETEGEFVSARAMILDAYKVGDAPVSAIPLIHSRITE